MAENKRYIIDMKRLSLGETEGFEASKGFLECRKSGSFISGRFDGGVKNREWGRLRLDIRTEGYCGYEISAIASNEGEKPPASAWEDGGACCRIRNLPELLLHRASGRYLWFCLDVHGSAKLSGGALYTFDEAFEDYLPQIYRNKRESFSHRYLSVFFTAYHRFAENISDFGKNLDAKTAAEDFLPLLARWMGLGSLCGLLTPEELRRFLLHGRYLSRYRGTRRAVLAAAGLITGKKPALLEQIKIHENTAPSYSNTYGRLYGENKHIVLLIFFDSIDDNVCIRLQRLTDMLIPVGCSSRLVVKENSSVLDGYTYLDYNARFIYNADGSASGIKTDEGFTLS